MTRAIMSLCTMIYLCNFFSSLLFKLEVKDLLVNKVTFAPLFLCVCVVAPLTHHSVHVAIVMLFATCEGNFQFTTQPALSRSQ
jgi:hypothetical protein